MSNELDLLVELRLHGHDVLLEARFTLLLGPQTETLHASSRFIHDQEQVFASAQRVHFHGAASINVK